MKDKAQLRHVVLFGYKAETTGDQKHELARLFMALKNEVPGIEAIEWGENNSPEGLNDGLEHCYFVTFGTAEARDAYLPHPGHQAFVQQLRPHLEKAVVVDYWARS